MQVTNIYTYNITRDGIYDYIDMLLELKNAIYSKCFISPALHCLLMSAVYFCLKL